MAKLPSDAVAAPLLINRDEIEVRAFNRLTEKWEWAVFGSHNPNAPDPDYVRIDPARGFSLEAYDVFVVKMVHRSTPEFPGEQFVVLYPYNGPRVLS